MKKLLSIVGCALCASVLVAGEFFPVSVKIPAGDTSKAVVVNLYRDGGETCGAVDMVSIASTSTSTGTVAFAAIDYGIAGSNLASIVVSETNFVYNSWPLRSYVPTGTTTNAVPYLVRRMKVTVSQPVAASVDTIWNGGISVQ